MSGVVQNKRTSESKFVSVMADAQPDVDISFREPLLSRPSDHYLVGVDNLTLNMNSLPMIDLEDDATYVIRVVRHSGVSAQDYFDDTAGTTMAVQIAGAAGELRGNVYRAGESFELEQNFQNIQQFVWALQEFAEKINTIFTADIATHIVGYNVAVGVAAPVPLVPYISEDAAAADKLVKHLEFQLQTDGRLRVIGTRAFWANCFLMIEKPQHQYALQGRRTTSTVADGAMQIAMNDGNQSYDPILLQNATHVLFEDQGVLGFTAANISNATTPAHLAYRNTKLQYILGANLWSTLDRRIAVEIGCSLPIVNNPMVDHNKEHPDFTIGRWMFNPRARISALGSGINASMEVNAPSIVEYQNSTDRVAYHNLMPQDKLHTLRLKLYCRVRAYDSQKDEFKMETKVMPTKKTDWWHCRIHFVSKD